MNHTELFRTYLHHYANKKLEAISAMLAKSFERLHRSKKWFETHCHRST